jgi:hypothetical protein
MRFVSADSTGVYRSKESEVLDRKGLAEFARSDCGMLFYVLLVCHIRYEESRKIVGVIAAWRTESPWPWGDRREIPHLR